MAGLGAKLAEVGPSLSGSKMAARDSLILPSLMRKGKKISKVWISPADWKRMDPEKQAILVSLWHDYESYNDNFPFEQMRIRAKETQGVTVLTEDGEEGLSFHFYGTDMKKAGLVESLKEFKIPHTLKLESRREEDNSKAEVVRG